MFVKSSQSTPSVCQCPLYLLPPGFPDFLHLLWSQGWDPGAKACTWSAGELPHCARPSRWMPRWRSQVTFAGADRFKPLIVRLWTDGLPLLTGLHKTVFPLCPRSPKAQSHVVLGWCVLTQQPLLACCAGDALTYLGLPALPEGTGLPLHIGGTPNKPEVEVGRCAARCFSVIDPAPIT